MYGKIAVLLILALILPVFAAVGIAEEVPPKYITDNGGGVIGTRSPVLTPYALVDELEIVYMECSSTYLMLNEEATWTAHAQGGDGNYKYTFFLYYRDETNVHSAVNMYEHIATRSKSDSNTYTYRITKPGRYILIIYLYGDNGQRIQWQSQAFQTAVSDDFMNPNTVPGKVDELAALCIRSVGNDPYAQALWMHDWIINNSVYDNTYSYYFADGVLLNGTGLCNSYALAYELLMKALGFECRYVIGYAGTTAHAWNVIKMDGKWYQVDCTWDDLTSSGEDHDFFMVNDDIMSAGHTWSTTAWIPPCSDLDLYYYLRNGAKLVSNGADVEKVLVQAVDARREYVVMVADSTAFNLYTQTKNVLDTIDGDVVKNWSVTRPDSWILYLWLDYSGITPAEPQLDAFEISCAKSRLQPGDTVGITAEYSPDRVYAAGRWKNVRVNWTSSDSSVLSVSADGIVAAHRQGSAVITATCGDISRRLRFYVLDEDVSRVVISASAIEIGEEAFANCDSLASVLIPEGNCTTIGARAFADCGRLGLIQIPRSVTQIENDAFAGDDGVIILCTEGSFAHDYAVAHDMAYILTD